LRREALERQGWKLYRLWSMDWYQRPSEQLERLVSAIESEKRRITTEAGAEIKRSPLPEIERDDNTDAFAVPLKSDRGAYVEALVTRPADGFELLNTPVSTLAAIIAEIVDTEGPIHQDEVVIRVRSAWGLQRAGTRIQEHLDKAIRMARAFRGIERAGKFLTMPGRAMTLRDRSGVASRSLRLPEMLAPAEIRAGVAEVVRENFGARKEEIVGTVLRRIGYAASGANLREVVESAIRKMRATGVLSERGDLFILEDSMSTSTVPSGTRADA
jgi:hypothetical protein